MLIDDRTDEPPKAHYAARVNRAIDYVTAHLHEPVRLDDVARVASFSPFHFHRVFRSLVGETLNQFVRRLRLERALRMMAHGGGATLTQVALACGFASSSDFTRAFRDRYGVPPSAFDLDTWRERRRDELEERVNESDGYRLSPRLEPGENPDGFEARVRDLPERRVAYIRVLDPFGSHGVVRAVETLLAWADERGLADGQWLGYMWEDPEVVPLADCRYDVAVTVGDAEIRRDEMSTHVFPPMRVAEVEVRGGLELEQRALDWLFRTWLPASGYVPADQPCFEAWFGRPFAHGMHHFELAAHLPIVRG